MVKVTGVRFKKMGKIYYFDPGKLELENGMHVVVETARGIEYGLVVIGSKEVSEDKIVPPLKKVLRIATAEDDRTVELNKKKEAEAMEICRQKIEKHQLEMKLIDVEYTFDHNKILFYFTAEGRIDFRELVRDLAAVFKTRIELRQIGVRDEAKMIGGLGVCGRVLCCNSYMGDFEPVSIKMVKEQNLSLNPTKISGTCGRLMCCLKNEQAAYEALAKNAPGVGSLVETEDGKGIVSAVSILKGIVTVTVGDEEKTIKDYKIKDVKILKRSSRRDEEKIDMSELKQLED
ncbi:MAG: stage 0 sporulation family protein [Clostridia bacterium]|nr:stage 0 sporulation family protein [Clostridia bacterium]